MAYEGMIAETISINGDKHEPISAYVARPLGPGPFPGIVLMHHAPGWDEFYRETTRRFAHHGYVAIRDRKSTRLNSSHIQKSRMPSSA